LREGPLSLFTAYAGAGSRLLRGCSESGRTAHMPRTLLLCMLLGACTATRELPPVADPAAAWQARNAKLATLETWRLEGRIGVVTEEDGGSATLHWQQSPQSYEIELFGPFGSGRVRLYGNDTTAVLETSEGEALYAGSAEALFEQGLGWPVPVEPLRRWVLGLSDANDAFELDRQGRLATLTHDRWQVNFLAYRDVEGFDLPRKLAMHTDGLNIKLVVHEWQLHP